MEHIEAGMLAKSKAGHDKGTIYVILRTEKDLVYLCDGTYKKLENPKKKKEKHIQIVKRIPEELIQTGSLAEIRDEDIKRAIKAYKKSRLAERVI